MFGRRCGISLFAVAELAERLRLMLEGKK